MFGLNLDIQYTCNSKLILYFENYFFFTLLFSNFILLEGNNLLFKKNENPFPKNCENWLRSSTAEDENIECFRPRLQ